MKDELKNAGFTELREVDAWKGKLKGGGSYYFTRNGSTIGAFTVGTGCNDGDKGNVSLFKMVGCHTDSPVIKLAPHAKVANKLGYQQMNVQTYGGGLWRTWFDRDLGLAGKVIVQSTDGEKSHLTSMLWDSKGGVVSIPSLCIHLETADERQAFKPNKETHLKTIMATTLIDNLMGEAIKDESEDVYKVKQKNFETFLTRIADDLEIEVSQIVDFEFSCYDMHPPAITGLHKEFVASPRLDNLASSLASLDALISYHKEDGAKDNSEVALIMLFDHEEVGSQSAQGADSNMIVEVTDRIHMCFGSDYDQWKYAKEAYYRAIKKSYLISADMAHAIHPNYPEKHQAQHHPKIHEGVVLKINANQRYMTDSVSAAIMRVIANNAEPAVPLQDFIVKQDGACGSTIGPMIAAKAGVKTIDIGVPQLSMHSIRETCGVIDLLHYKHLFAAFFN